MFHFDSDFPCGGGRLINHRRDAQGDVVCFQAESKLLEPRPNWFYFRVSGLCGRRTRFVLANAEQCLDDGAGAAGWAQNRPVYRVAGGSWQRVAEVRCTLGESLTWEVAFDVPGSFDALEVAFCYPYAWEHLAETIKACGAFRQAAIGYSAQGRPITRLSSSMGGAGREKPGVYILGRQHSGEVTGTWIIDGMLRHLVSPQGREAFERLVWWFVPMVDIDGVQNGCYGKDQAPRDFNRSWGIPTPHRLELAAIQRDMERWDAICRAGLVLDMHSPAHERRGMFIIPSGIASKRQREGLESLLGHINALHVPLGNDPMWAEGHISRRESDMAAGLTAAEYAMKRLGVPATALEASYQGEKSGRCYTREDYRRFGQTLVQAIVGFLGA